MRRTWWCGALIGASLTGCVNCQQSLAQAGPASVMWDRWALTGLDGGETQGQVRFDVGQGPPACAQVPGLAATQDGEALVPVQQLGADPKAGGLFGGCASASWTTAPVPGDAGTTTFEFTDGTRVVRVVYAAVPMATMRFSGVDGGRPEWGEPVHVTLDGPHGRLFANAWLNNPDGGPSLLPVDALLVHADAGGFDLEWPDVALPRVPMLETVSLTASVPVIEVDGGLAWDGTITMTGVLAWEP